MTDDANTSPSRDERASQAVRFKGSNAGWFSVFVESGLDRTVDQMGGYFGNMAIVSALLGAFSFTALVTPVDALDLDSWSGRLGGFLGVLGVCAFTASVIECVMLDNSIKFLSTSELLLGFLDEQQTTMQLPVVLFIAGVILAFAQLLTVLAEMYCIAFAYASAVPIIIMLVGLLRRHIKLSTWRARFRRRRSAEMM